jgi:hypothetical protein
MLAEKNPLGQSPSLDELEVSEERISLDNCDNDPTSLPARPTVDLTNGTDRRHPRSIPPKI